MARRLLIDHYRRQSLEQAGWLTLAQLPAPAAPSAEERLLILETLHQIDAMLDGLGRESAHGLFAVAARRHGVCGHRRTL